MLLFVFCVLIRKFLFLIIWLCSFLFCSYGKPFSYTSFMHSIFRYCISFLFTFYVKFVVVHKFHALCQFHYTSIFLFHTLCSCPLMTDSTFYCIFLFYRIFFKYHIVVLPLLSHTRLIYSYLDLP